MVSDHEMPYLEVDTICCRFCKTVQPFSLKCVHCMTLFGLIEASCLICKRIDFKDANSQPFYHCH